MSTPHHRCTWVTVLLTVLVAAGCSQQNEAAPGPTNAPGHRRPIPAQSAAPGWTTRMVTLPPELQHVHAIVANKDGSVLAGTHAGLYHLDPDGRATAIGRTRHDLMGLVRADDGTVLASGHPEPGSGLAEPLGLIASADGGQTWQPRALEGQADFHSLSARGERMAGLSAEMLLTSSDAGHTWTPRRPTASLTLSLDIRTIWAAGQEGLLRSDDDGNSFRAVADAPRLALATAANDHTPWGVDVDGVVWVRPGNQWERVEAVGAADAIAAVDADTAFVVHQGSLVILDRTDHG